MPTSTESLAAVPFLTKYPSASKLQALAKRLIDLTAPETLSPQRIASYCSEACGFKLLYATERVNDEVLKCLGALAAEANVHGLMAAMQDGEVLNRIEGYASEDRPVLHTAQRDIFGEPRKAAPARAAAELARNEHAKLKSWIEKIDQENKFTDLILIGIGGSDLGPRALYIALKRYQKPGRRVHFIANVDPDNAAMVFQEVDPKKTIAVVISKSGTTLETLTNETFVREFFTKGGCKPEKHIVAVTSKDSPMDDASKYQQAFHMWDYVGGRYSATSMVGAVMLSFGVGYENTREVLRGAHEMDRVALEADYRKNLPLLSALLGVWNRNFLAYPTVAVIPYAETLSRFPAHLQQCDMESNGKRIDRQGNPVDYSTGPVVWGEPGTNGQHSFFQLIHQGTTPVPVEFIGFKDSQFGVDITVQGTTSQQKLLSNLFAQSLALATGKQDSNPNKVFPGNRPSRILLGKRLTPYSLGALLSYYENKVAFQGFLWNINSFDQEGVQLGKVLANRVLGLFSGAKESFPAGSAMLKHLEGM